MSESKAIQFFNDNAAALSAQYNSLDRAKVHAELLARISGANNLKMLDVGAGSGADANMFAEMGHEVVAAEPAEKLRTIANETFKNTTNIKWNDDLLPALPTVTASGETFDVIYSLGAIQYLDEADRTASLEKMASLLKDGGLLELSYPTPASRVHQFSVGTQEVESFVSQFNKASGKGKLEIVHEKKTREISGRKALDGSDLYFQEFIIKRVAPPAI